MSYAQITVTAYSQVVLSDVLGLEASAPEATFTRLAAGNGQTVVVTCTGPVWDRLRPQLRSLSQLRLPHLPGRTRPAMTYTMKWVPGDRPRIHQVSGAVSLASGAALTVTGENLVPGLKAKLTLTRERAPLPAFHSGGLSPQYSQPEDLMTFTAVQKGPGGNQIGIWIKEASGAGSVSVEEFADGKVLIAIVPAAGQSTTTAIAAQVSGSTLASVWITATALIAGAQVPAFAMASAIVGPNAPPVQPYRMLTGGDGTGIAFADLLVAGTNPTNRLRVQAQKAGNQGNLISIQLLGGQGSDRVVVNGSDIVVERTAATTTLANLATAINGNAAAAALVRATAVGAGSLGTVAQTFLACGAGEQILAQLGGATAGVTQHSDTSILVDVSSAALTAAGITAGKVTQLNLLLDYQRLSASLVAAS